MKKCSSFKNVRVLDIILDKIYKFRKKLEILIFFANLLSVGKYTLFENFTSYLIDIFLVKIALSVEVLGKVPHDGMPCRCIDQGTSNKKRNERSYMMVGISIF